MRAFLYARARAFQFAFDGWAHLLRTQPNAWIHALATILAILTGWWAGINATGWVFLVLAIGAVWAAELFNTAVEAIVDLCHPDTHPLAKIAKDTGAAAVLAAAVTSIIVGGIILGPPLWVKLFG